MSIDLIIGSGGVISHAPRSQQAAAMLIDGFLPQGITRLAKDTIFMLPHLGALHAVLPEAAHSVYAHDCIQELGTCVAPVGQGRPGERCLAYRLEVNGLPPRAGEVACGALVALPLAPGQDAALELAPARRFDVQAGHGKRWQGTVRGGPAGLILDCRGRPLLFPEERGSWPQTARAWQDALNAAQDDRQ